MRQNESFVSQPVRSLQTMLRVLAKDDRRLPLVIPDGIYGPATMNAVAAFQRQNGLPVTGVADQATWEAIHDRYDEALIRVGKPEPVRIILNAGQVLQRRERSPYLYLVQSMLTVLSQEHPAIPAPPHTGILDPETAASLAAFQILTGLEVTGELDKVTWKHLSHQFTLTANHQATQNVRQTQRVDRL